MFATIVIESTMILQHSKPKTKSQPLYLVHFCCNWSIVFWVNLQQNFTSYKTFTTIVHHKYFPVLLTKCHTLSLLVVELDSMSSIMPFPEPDDCTVVKSMMNSKVKITF